ncbi:MAG: hypothetical protein NT149_01280 [Candidatus Gottesmanbacteria bacterium]|nr:hypothetical protein [Candidatus Gottesmanbacteria bacterium]
MWFGLVRFCCCLPRTLEAAWFILLGYCAVRTLFSDSIGYSISTIIRPFDAWMRSDIAYTKKKSFRYDLRLFLRTIGFMGSLIGREIFGE